MQNSTRSVVRVAGSSRLWLLGILCLAATLGATTARASDLDYARRSDSARRFLEAGTASDFFRDIDIGELRLNVSSYGALGNLEFPVIIPSLPWYLRITYLDAFGLTPLFGSIRNLDTLVSANTGETYNEVLDDAPLHAWSTDQTSPEYDPRAKAEQEYYARYSDTSLRFSGGSSDGIELRPHLPIGIEVHQTSYGWSELQSKRFVIFDLWIINTTDQPIEEGCVGLMAWPSVHCALLHGGCEGGPTICGFLPTAPGIVEGIADTIDLAWAANTDGGPDTSGTRFNRFSETGAMGLHILRAPHGGRVNFNWWSSDFLWGPRKRDHLPVVVNDYTGDPFGDRSRYKLMTNGEIDYDQVYSAIDYSADGWEKPLQYDGLANRLAGGYGQIGMLLSYGPFDPIPPHDSVPFTYAVVMGGDFHNDPQNYVRNFHPENPAPYLDRLDFTDLVANARWAEWIFDNPGVDTDGDGYRGRFHLVDCDGAGHCDTIFYTGDGVPDFRGPQAPPPPKAELTTRPHEAILRWTGAESEFARDSITRKTDFEGYRVYVGKTADVNGFSLVASWDKEDYKRFSYHAPTNDWRQNSDPLTIEQWRDVLHDPDFDPSRHVAPSFESSYRDTAVDTIRNVDGRIVDVLRRERFSYWQPQEANQTNTYTDLGVTRTNRIQQVGTVDTIIAGQPLTYGVYELQLDNLNGAQALYFSVTAFDYGDFQKRVDPLESKPGRNAVFGFPIYSSDVVVDSGLRVSV
ncbi:MAG: hypothetical protein HY304_05005, partial [candidate division Zixibacteria bacterium]|nr:hypothetical protein [candidate division Zixibacteria bacterium]